MRIAAAWAFVLRGVLHGCYIGVFRVWTLAGVALPLFLARTLTLLAVFWAWVLFRAETLRQTAELWRGMAGMMAWRGRRCSGKAFPLDGESPRM